MTPEQAKEKWCPFASAGASFNRLNVAPTVNSCNCIAEQCMAWRWHKSVENDGYCGLAGIPE